VRKLRVVAHVSQVIEFDEDVTPGLLDQILAARIGAFGAGGDDSDGNEALHDSIDPSGWDIEYIESIEEIKE
jgi:hypothetical protein